MQTPNSAPAPLTAQGVSPLFDAIGLAQGGTEQLTLRRGDVLIEQGSDGDAIFFVEAGRFTVDRNGTALAEIGTGESIGEIAFFTGMPRTARVVAARDSVVLKLSRTAYDAACARDPAIASLVARDLANRLAATSTRVRSEPRPPQTRVVTLIPAGDEPLPHGLVPALTETMERAGGRVLTLRDAPADPSDSSGRATVIGWMQDLERSGVQVLAVADPASRGWTELALRQSDQVLIAGHAGPSPALSDLERLAFDILPEEHRRLLLLHPERPGRVTGTADWLDARPVFMHHHAAMGAAGDLDRLVRFLTGRALGYVAGGGGAFGPIHTGIYQGLCDAGARFDIFGGTSVGSAMCAGFALGLSGDEIETLTHEIFVTNKALNRLTVPRYSILDHTMLDRQLQQNAPGLIEDLWYPFFAVATDLSSNRQVAIRRGPLWQAIRASAAIPGVLPPFYTDDGTMLVDGGSMDNMPYHTMHGLKSGPNVIVSFERDGRQAFQVDYDRLPGRGTLLRRLVWPFGKRPPRAPGALSVVMRSLLARQAADRPDLGPEDWHIRATPPKGANFMDWTNHAQLYAVGKALVAKQLAEDHGPDDPRAAVMRGAG